MDAGTLFTRELSRAPDDELTVLPDKLLRRPGVGLGERACTAGVSDIAGAPIDDSPAVAA
ncbi:hypothetical protein [Nocardia carnea]|uniref:Uncharacterized protein n=1 Tax=Nocardia carnea TaxID=37328 RepID=A0ABW7TQP2_9NOCA|nr:hypothetical protein [Nocardia carnea]